MHLYLYLSCKQMLCSSTVTDVGNLIDSAGFRLLENMKAVAMAVSGTRKVACVVSDSCVNCKFYKKRKKECASYLWKSISQLGGAIA